MEQSYRKIELRDVSAKVLKTFPNTKKGKREAFLLARINKRKTGMSAFVYRVTETRIK